MRIVSRSIVANSSGGDKRKSPMRSPCSKYSTKVITFAAVSHEFKSDLVAVESGTIAIAYVDDFVDTSDIISEMNGRYRMKKRMHMHLAASVHRVESTVS
jgi:hypothetical protein